MTTKMILACAGLAACGAQGQYDPSLLEAQTVVKQAKPVWVQAITGVTADNQNVYGPRIYLNRDGQNPVAARGAIVEQKIYDGVGLLDDTDGDGFDELVCGDLCIGGTAVGGSRYAFPDDFEAPFGADDFEMASETLDGNNALSGIQFITHWATCDDADAANGEPLNVVFRMFDSVDLVADIDGISDGFDNDGDGFPDSPVDLSDNDGDGLIDSFTGGFAVGFANVDVDGDGLADNLGQGPWNLSARELTDTDGDGILGDVDFGTFPTGDRDGDGRPDGTFELYVVGDDGADTDGDGTPDGPIFGFDVAQSVASLWYWAPSMGDTSGCADANGGVGGSSEGILWAQGVNDCDPASTRGAGGSFSGAGGVVDLIWDASTDVSDNAGVFPCPDPLTYAVSIFGQGAGGTTNDRLCADTNGDGSVTPADFNAWIIGFNTQSVACDQNNDGLCTPADFNAWIINFNQGAAGPLCPAL